jgi:hypothetical protein
MRSICIALHAGREAILFPLLQQGLTIRTDIGVSLESFLTGTFGVPVRYIDERISTILLDGKPVDHLGSVVVRNGSVLALSAAMPGLAGATLRRGGHLAPFREGITYKHRGENPSLHSGIVTVKIFNVLIRELGMPLLNRGILMGGGALAAIVKSLPEEFADSCSRIVMDNEALDTAELLSDGVRQSMEGDETWLLRVIT